MKCMGQLGESRNCIRSNIWQTEMVIKRKGIKKFSALQMELFEKCFANE